MLERFPFILQIEAIEVAILLAVIDDPDRDVTRLGTICIHRKHERGRADGGVLFGKKKTAAKGVLVVELVARIKFDPVRDNVAIHPRSDAVENQVAHFVRPE